MPSVVDICNTALSHIGDTANISSIDPPDGSAQAVHCSRFYPISRDSLLEMHDWNFSSMRAPLALLDNTSNQWAYCYAAPNKLVAARKVMDAQSSDDWSVSVNATPSGDVWSGMTPPYMSSNRVGVYTGQPFIVERLGNGAQVIRTNQPNALLLYTVKVDDPTKFSPLFCEVLAFLLASKLAGPLIKGTEGRAVAKEMLGLATAFLSRATASDAGQRHLDIAPSVPWMVNR